jgi:glycosyltransferase involved in cell wall biosynthesis
LDRKINVQLVCTNFVHNKKLRRETSESAYNKSLLPFVCEIDSTAYSHNISVKRIIHELVFGLKALKVVHRNRPTDLLIGEPVFFIGWIFLIYAHIFRVKIKTDLIDVWPEADTGFNRKTVNLFSATAYGFLKLSRRLRLRLYHDVSFVSISYVAMLNLSDKARNVFYWGSDLKPETEHAQIGRRPLTIIYAGSFGEGYDLLTVLEAAKMLASNPNVRVKIVFAGQGTYSEMVKMAAAQGIIEYAGNVDKNILIEMYANCDVGLLPYKSSSMVAMPIKYFDYINFGLFSLTSLALEVREVIDRERIGLVYEAGNSLDLYTKILEIARHPERLASTKRRCKGLADFYSIEVQYKAFAEWVIQ